MRLHLSGCVCVLATIDTALPGSFRSAARRRLHTAVAVCNHLLCESILGLPFFVFLLLMGSKADGHLPLSWYGVFAVAAVAPSAVVLNALIGVAVGCMRRAAARNAWSPWAGWETRGGDIWHEHVGARVIGLVCVTEGSVFR